MNHDSRQPAGSTGGHTHPVDVLAHEHRTILAVLAAADRELDRLAADRPLRPAFWYGYLEFLAQYADRRHHGKEEDLLFAELERAGLPHDHGPTHCLRAEHEAMRAARRRLAELLTGDDVDAIGRSARAGIDLLREHIDKEDRILLPMARSMLDSAAEQRLRAAFAQLEDAAMGEGVGGRHDEMVRNLCIDADLSACR